MEFRVLGPVEVWSGSASLTFPRRQQRLILGILALDVGRVVSVDRLIDLLWGDRPPAQARATIHSRISELRAILSAAQKHETNDVAMINRRENAYSLEAAPDSVDAHRFRGLVHRARTCATEIDARNALDAAIKIWRGPALGGWLPRESHEALCQGLESARLSALEDLFDVELRLGRHHEVVDEILDVSISCLSRERLTLLAMQALRKAGRTPEALLAYDRYRRWAAGELGIDPDSQLQELYLSILHREQDPPARDAGSIKAQPSATVQTDSPRDLPTFKVAVPSTLPSDISDFTGREAEIANLLDAITRRRTGVPVVVVTGPGGVGKTALSIHVAHRLRSQFPEGQLFADLHGADWERPPTSSQLLGRFLRALGVESGLPDGLDERIDLYRRLLSERKVLVVLDNAASLDQVIPLIPGSTSCAALINSRIRIGPSLAAEAIELGVLGNSPAMNLLARIAGEERVRSEPDAASALIQLCDGLPLAIRVAAAKMHAKPHWNVGLMVDRLRDERRRLHHLSHDHLSVRSSIGFSYQGLTSAGKRLVALLGDIDYPEANVWSAAALLDTGLADAEEVLEQLHDAQLTETAGVEPTGYAKYRLHDLVRLFAGEQALLADPKDLQDARQRVLGAWLHLLEEVERRAAGGHYLTVRSQAPKWPVEPELVADISADPLTWFDIERTKVVHMIRKAADGGHSELCHDLAIASSPLFQMRAYHDDWGVALDIAYDAAVQAGDDRGRAALLIKMGTFSGDRLEYQRAREQFLTAQHLFALAGARYGVAVATAQLAVLDRYMGRIAEAMAGLVESLPGLREECDQIAEAFVLRNIGQIHLQDGQLPAAEDYFRQALCLARHSKSRRAEAQIGLWKGMLLQKQERYQDAERQFANVLEVAGEVGDHGGQAQALHSLGICYRTQGKLAAAYSVLSRACSLVSQPRPIRIEVALREQLASLADEMGDVGKLG